MPAPSPVFAPSKAQLGYGSAFFMGAGSPVNYTEISEIASVAFADYTVSVIDVTSLASPNATEESIPGLLKPGTIEMTGNYIGDASQIAIDPIATARTIFPWMITATTSSGKTLTVTGFGYITKKETGPFEPNKKQDFKVSVQVAGAVTWTVA
jgi:hypothetical protein